MARNVPQQAQRFAMYEFLKTVLSKAEDGFCVYAEPWTDSLIAEKFNMPVDSVRNTRVQVFGKLRASRLAASEIETRIAALEAEVKDIRLAVAKLIGPRLL